MNHVLHWASLAVSRLGAGGRAVRLDEVRDFIWQTYGQQASGMSDQDLRNALLTLQDSNPMSLSCDGSNVTCTPLPAGWIPVTPHQRAEFAT